MDAEPGVWDLELSLSGVGRLPVPCVPSLVGTCLGVRSGTLSLRLPRGEEQSPSCSPVLPLSCWTGPPWLRESLGV